MSEAELLLIGMTLVLSTGMVRCVDGLYHAIMSPRRYWIPQVLLWSTFIYGANFLWAYKDNLTEDPSYPLYASTIAIAATFVLRAHILATNDPAQVEDWAEQFHKSARPYFVIAFLTSMLSIIAAWSSRESSGFDAASIPFWIGMGLNATGAISKKIWVWGTVAVLHLTLVVLASYILFSNNMI